MIRALRARGIFRGGIFHYGILLFGSAVIYFALRIRARLRLALFVRRFRRFGLFAFAFRLFFRGYPRFFGAFFFAVTARLSGFACGVFDPAQYRRGGRTHKEYKRYNDHKIAYDIRYYRAYQKFYPAAYAAAYDSSAYTVFTVLVEYFNKRLFSLRKRSLIDDSFDNLGRMQMYQRQHEYKVGNTEQISARGRVALAVFFPEHGYYYQIYRYRKRAVTEQTFEKGSQDRA